MPAKDPLVKDMATGEYKPRSTLWRASNKKYYTSEEAWLKIEAEKDAKKQAAEQHKTLMLSARKRLYELVGIPFTDVPPGVLLKKEKELRTAYGDEAFYEGVIRCSDDITNALAWKQADSKITAALYAFGVLRNRMPDIVADIERENRIKKELDEEPVDDGPEIWAVGKKQVYRDLTKI